MYLGTLSPKPPTHPPTLILSLGPSLSLRLSLSLYTHTKQKEAEERRGRGLGYCVKLVKTLVLDDVAAHAFDHDDALEVC
jgi:hypothetical protein